MTTIAWVATYAAVVSTASLIVAVLAYRSGDPRLHPSTHLRPGQGDLPAELVIVVKNTGRAPGEVANIELAVPGPHTISLGGEAIRLFAAQPSARWSRRTQRGNGRSSSPNYLP